MSGTLPGSILPGVPAEVFGPAGPSDGAASSRVLLEASTEDAVGPLDGDALDGPIPSCADLETDHPCDVPARSPLQGGIDSTDESSSSSSSDSSSEASEDPQANAPALRPPPAWREGCTVWRHSKTGTLHLAASSTSAIGGVFVCGRSITSVFRLTVTHCVLESSRCNQCDRGRHIRTPEQLSLQLEALVKRQRVEP